MVGQAAQLGLEAPALGDIAQDAGHDDRVVVAEHRAERDIDRELAAVLAAAGQLGAAVGGARDRGVEAVRGPRARALREEVLDRAADELRALVAEQLLGAGVGEHDPARRVDADDRVRSGLQHPRPVLGLLARRDVPDDAAEEARAALLPGGERELDRELRSVGAQPDDLDRLADDARSLRAPGDALDAGVVHRPEALGHEERERLAEHALGAVAEHPLRGGVPRQDQALAVGGDDRVIGRLGDRAEPALGLAQRHLRPQPRDQPAELAPDVRRDLEQPVIRRHRLQREAFDHRDRLVRRADREREPAPQPDTRRARAAREVRRARDVDDPLRPSALEHPPGKPDAARQHQPLGLVLERREASGIAQVPQRRGHRPRGVGGIGEVHVSDRPARSIRTAARGTPTAHRRPSARCSWRPRRARSGRPGRHRPPERVRTRACAAHRGRARRPRRLR